MASPGGSDLQMSPSPAASQLEGAPCCCCCGRCARWIRRCIPIGCLAEAKELTKLAGPLILSQLFVFLLPLVSAIFCGQLGKEELDGVSLANAVMTVTGYSLGIGFSSATDTLLSQTFGGRNLKKIGSIMQQAFILLILISFPCSALIMNTENLLLLAKQDPKVARLAGDYALICVPTVLEVFIFLLQMTFLQNQGITIPQMYTGIVVNIINAILHYVFLFELQLGVQGAALAVNIARICQVLMLFLYIWIKKLHVGTWGGWSWDCLQGWDVLISLAIPGILTVCFEWWVYDIGTILAGLISVNELGAQSVMYQVVIYVYMIPFSIGAAVGVRVGNALGAGNVEQAKQSASIAFLIIGVLIVVDITVIGGLRMVITRVFTSDKDINALVARVILVYLLFHVFESIACTANGVLKGIGKQKIGAVVYGVSYYVIGLPLAAVLMFVVKLGVIGLWGGITVAAFIPAVFLTAYITRVNWKDLAEKAQERIGLKQKTKGRLAASYRISLSEEENTKIGIIFPENDQIWESSDQCTLTDLPVPRDVRTNTDFLPVKSLVLRRGLAVMSAVLSLIAGVLVKVLLVL